MAGLVGLELTDEMQRAVRRHWLRQFLARVLNPIFTEMTQPEVISGLHRLAIDSFRDRDDRDVRELAANSLGRKLDRFANGADAAFQRCQRDLRHEPAFEMAMTAAKRPVSGPWARCENQRSVWDAVHTGEISMFAG